MLNAQLAAMVRERDANKRARLAGIVQADIEAVVQKLFKARRTIDRIVAMGFVEIPIDDDEPLELRFIANGDDVIAATNKAEATP